ncbi:MAG TPA: DHA2 family efflux MFS transporter permease subunit [Solirubrobacteraceae bacterium]|jgi:EmrB/QacA subfamily drug resistance transporter|nr:DHA2 family efflux MFS transporter permease subunit [Solirubrobacteraceae bacterium]
MSTVSATASGTNQDRARWIALVVLCVGMLMIILDSTVVNVALPAIQHDLSFSQPNLAWVINAYLISFGGLLLLAGRLGDLVGRRRVFMIGLVLFTTASLLCGLAQSQALLIGARFLQGIGGALTSAVILGMVVTMFPEPAERTKAIGVYSFVAAAGASLGLLLGGVVTQAINWHWIFFINLPIGVITGLLATRLVEPDGEVPGLHRGVDIAGAALVTAALMLAVFTIVKAGGYGWASARTLGSGAGVLALLIAFVVREATAKDPLVPLRIFRSRNVSGANVVQLLMVASLFGMFFLGALFMQHVLGYSAIGTGFAFLPVSLGIGVFSLGLSARFINRFGAKATLLPGLALLAGGLGLLARAPVGSSYALDLLPSMILLGAGAGLSFPSLMTLAMSGATPRDAGLASGLVNTTVQVGGALGLAVLATLSTTRTSHLLAAGASQPAALTGGYHLAWVISGSVAAAALLIGAWALRPAEIHDEEEELLANAPAYVEAA